MSQRSLLEGNVRPATGSPWSRGLRTIGVLLVVCGADSGCTSGGDNASDMGAADLAVGDKTAPRFSGLASATATGTTTVDLQWGAASDDRSAAAQLTYQVFVATASLRQNFATPSFQTAAGATAFQVTGLDLATKYFFVVRARDEAGNVDTNLTERSATTLQQPDTMAPTFAGASMATASANTITLSWTQGTDDVASPSQLRYALFLSKTMGSYDFNKPEALTPPGVSSYTLTGLDAQTAYYLVARAQDPSGNRETNIVEKTATTGSIGFAGQVWPIFNGSCGGASCHTGGSPQDGLDLNSAAKAYMSLVSQPSAHCTSDLRVSPNMPDKSYLLWKLGLGMGACLVGNRMPSGGNLSAGDINTIRGWIAAGALNN